MNKNDQLFSELLYLLHHNAFNALDNIDNTNFSESDLNSVRQLIDMVVMLKEKQVVIYQMSLINQTMMLSELESKISKNLKQLKQWINQIIASVL